MSKPTGKLAMAYSTIATMEARIKELECQRPAGVAVPDGWALVPAEPTEQMISAGSEAAHAGGCDLYRMKREVMNAWPAMLAAAPHPVSGERLSVKRYGRDEVADHSDVEIVVPGLTHYDHGPNLAEALARLAYRVAKFHKLDAPTLFAPPAAQDVAGLVGALEDITNDYAERFDMDSPSTNPGIKVVVENARAALAAHRAQQGEQQP